MSKEQVRKIKADMAREGIDMTSNQATYYLMEKMKRVGSIQKASILKHGDSPRMIDEGSFYYFSYRPKGREKLPYYDLYPLVYVMNRQEGGEKFLAVNFHYLDFRYRAWFINSMLKYATTKEWDKDPEAFLTLFQNAGYPTFKGKPSLRFYKPAIKSYRYDCISSPVNRVPPSDWKTVLFMPLEAFVGKTAFEVQTLSRKIIESRKK